MKDLRVAAINTHPIQHFAPLWREMAALPGCNLKVFFCTDWGVNEFVDPGFGTSFKWDVDLTSGYEHEFLKMDARPDDLTFWKVNNPVGDQLAAFKPDVVILFGYANATMWRTLAWARRNGVATVLFSDSELKHSRSLLTRVAKQAVVRLYYSQVDAASPIGNCNAAYYRAYGLPEEKLFWSGYPVEGKRFALSAKERSDARLDIRQQFGIAEDAIVFVSVGKYIARKRHADVANAWFALPEALRDRSHVVLLGEGELRPELEALARDSKGHIHLTGFVNQAGIPRYFSSADVLVMASDTDAHPLVVTEGAFAGLPVIASDAIGCVGPDDTVQEGRNGWVYESGSVASLARAMSEVLASDIERKRRAAAAEEIAQTQDASQIASDLLEACRRTTPRSLGSRLQTLLLRPRLRELPRRPNRPRSTG